VVDGGKGQLGVALAALADTGVRDLPVAALAKEKANLAGDMLVDRVYLPGRKNPVALREGTTTLHYLALLRDEAHRASNALRVRLGKRRRLRSGLADIPGVGAKTARALLRALGSLRAVQSATEQALVDAGATRAQARAIRAHFSDVSAPATTDATAGPATVTAASSGAANTPEGDATFMRDEGTGLDAEDAAVEAAFAEADLEDDTPEGPWEAVDDETDDREGDDGQVRVEPEPPGALARRGARHRRISHAAGSRTSNSAPPSGRLRASMRPP
jgi:excinuclease ABC subunit C